MSAHHPTTSKEHPILGGGPWADRALANLRALERIGDKPCNECTGGSCVMGCPKATPHCWPTTVAGSKKKGQRCQVKSFLCSRQDHYDQTWTKKDQANGLAHQRGYTEEIAKLPTRHCFCPTDEAYDTEAKARSAPGMWCDSTYPHCRYENGKGKCHAAPRIDS